MKYTSEILIDLPRARVIELFDDPGNLKQWQKGLQSFEHLSGTPGQPGATSKLRFDMNGRRIEMVETITRRNLPDEFSGTYEASGVYNVVENFFAEEVPHRTKWTAINEFRFTGFMRLIGLLFGGSFKKQSMQSMVDFKNFAEGADKRS